MITPLTQHFTLEELTITDHRQFDNTPNPDELANLNRLAKFLEQVANRSMTRLVLKTPASTELVALQTSVSQA